MAFLKFTYSDGHLFENMFTNLLISLMNPILYNYLVNIMTLKSGLDDLSLIKFFHIHKPNLTLNNFY